MIWKEKEKQSTEVKKNGKIKKVSKRRNKKWRTKEKRKKEANEWTYYDWWKKKKQLTNENKIIKWKTKRYSIALVGKTLRPFEEERKCRIDYLLYDRINKDRENKTKRKKKKKEKSQSVWKKKIERNRRTRKKKEEKETPGKVNRCKRKKNNSKIRQRSD